MKTATLGLRLLLALLLAGLVPAGHAQGKRGGGRISLPPVEASALTTMPVKELAVFKDGHAFVLHECELPTDAAGDIVIDTLPTPVMGTFWPYSTDPNAKLTAVVAGTRKVRSERKALSVRDMLEANPGVEVLVTEIGGLQYDATIVGVPKPPTKDEAADSPGGQGEASQLRLSTPANVILLRVHGGVKAVPLSRIQDVVFRDDPKAVLETTDSRKLLTLKLDWGDREVGQSANVGMVYLQSGVRWIPSYRLDIDRAGTARVRLQATLINELADIEGATVHLVVGVPSFRFRDTLDPIALQDTAARLSQYFQQDQQMQQAFHNSIMTQTMEPARMSGPAGVPEPAITSASRHEDMFVFEVENVTLRKGERMVVPVVEFTLPYEDVFTLDVAFAPPAEVRHNGNDAQLAELLRLLRSPKAMHCIRLENTSDYPLTTAPAIVLCEGQLLAQGMMTYTPRGAKSDLGLTTAVDIQVAKSDQETKRTPDAEKWGGNWYGRIDLAGKVSLTNHSGKSVRLEVTRHVLGLADTADHDGAVVQTSIFEDHGAQPNGVYPHWWRWYNWPHWWFRFNGVGRITWEFELDSGKSTDLGYTWHYYWR